MTKSVAIMEENKELIVPHFLKNAQQEDDGQLISVEAEYRGVTNAVQRLPSPDLIWELHTPLLYASLVYCDSVIVVYLSATPVQHRRAKHIDIDIDYVCDMVATWQVRVLHMSSRY
ncbi:ribonuclease H-like domain-containing protein [Tanacetum coccineum]